MIKNIECFWTSIQQDFQNLQKSKKKSFKWKFGDRVHTAKEYYAESLGVIVAKINSQGWYRDDNFEIAKGAKFGTYKPVPVLWSDRGKYF